MPRGREDARLSFSVVQHARERLAGPLHGGQALAGGEVRGILSVEVGGSGTEYVLGYFDNPAAVSASPAPPLSMAGLRSCFTAPGLVTGGRVQGAHQLAWMDVDGWAELGFAGELDLGMNDAEASALGEWRLRDGQDRDLIYVGLGTGAGSARVTDGRLTPVELSHRPGYGPGWCEGCHNMCSLMYRSGRAQWWSSAAA
jgi:hypothetical protein